MDASMDARTSRHRSSPLVPALNSYWIYIHVSVTLTSYAAFAMAGGLGLMYLFKERAEQRGSRSRFYAAFPDLETIDELGYKAIMIGFPLLAFGIILGAMWANYAWGGYWSWDPVETWSMISWTTYGIAIHLRVTFGWREYRVAWLLIIALSTVIISFFGVNFVNSSSQHFFNVQ